MYEDKKILMTAFSPEPTSESAAIYEYVKKRGANNISALYWGDERVAEAIPDDVTKIQIADRSAVKEMDLSDYDVIFRHQTTRPDWLPYSTAVTTSTREFFKHCPATIIAVTGTKGKGTTTTLIARMLERAGERVHLLGNIGEPALKKIDEIKNSDYVAFEISSFQLWDLEQSPHVAVVLMMAPDHMDVHSSLDEYVEAKSNIVRFQSPEDIVVHHPTNELTARVIETARSKKLPFMSEAAAHVEGEFIVIDGSRICGVGDVGLIGRHNLENVTAALSASWQITKNVDALADAIASFKGLEHRLELAGDVNGVRYFNDSFSASIPAAMAATEAFSEPKVMIFGGSDKGASYDELARTVAGQNVRKALLIGRTADAIAEEFSKHEGIDFTVLKDVTMKQIVERAADEAMKGDVVVLSPGCASFDMFKNYKDRGEQFKAAVGDLIA